MSDTENKSGITVKELAELSVMTALIVGGKEAMNILPNIHPVTLLLLLCVRFYGVKALYPAAAFALIESLLYGFSIWTVSYLYVWPLIVLAALPFRKVSSRLFWACFAGVFGLCFGALTAVPTALLSGGKAAVAYWVAGIPYDLIHGAANFLMVFLLLPVLERIMIKMHRDRKR